MQQKSESEPDKVFTEISYGLKNYGNMSNTISLNLKLLKQLLHNTYTQNYK